MIGDGLFLPLIVIDLIYILFSSRLGKESLIASILVNLMLISTFGAKLIPIFGFVTNVGNGFYAFAFFATNILLAFYGKKIAYKSIWITFAGLIVFVLMGQFVIRIAGDSSSSTISDAMTTVFANVPRIAFASITAYLVAQHVNYWIFSSLFLTKKKPLWLSSIISTFAAQAVDSVLFFTIAFVGTISPSLLLEALLTGFVIKTCVGLLCTPFLYAIKIIQE